MFGITPRRIFAKAESLLKSLWAGFLSVKSVSVRIIHYEDMSLTFGMLVNRMVLQ